MALQLTTANLLRTLKEFLEVWVNQILFYNRIYNSQIYDRYKSFGLIVMKSRSPQLSEFIENLIDNLLTKVLVNRQDEKKSGGFTGLDLILMVIYSIKTNHIKKKYTVDFKDLVTTLGDTVQGGVSKIHENHDSATIDLRDVSWEEIHVQFSGILYQHIKELKRMQRIEEKVEEKFMAGSEEEGEDMFFKMFVNLEKSVILNDYGWVRLNSVKEDSPRTLGTFTAVGEVNLQAINFDLHNEYFS